MIGIDQIAAQGQGADDQGTIVTLAEVFHKMTIAFKPVIDTFCPILFNLPNCLRFRLYPLGLNTQFVQSQIRNPYRATVSKPLP